VWANYNTFTLQTPIPDEEDGIFKIFFGNRPERPQVGQKSEHSLSDKGSYAIKYKYK
jgi:hypothetical protein